MLHRHPLALAVLASLLSPALALAQSTPESEQPVAATTSAAPTKGAELDKITVTGSRISRAGFDTLEPAQVIARENIEQLGITNVADSLFRQPGFSAGASSQGSQSSYGAGVNFVSRFNLGSNRELVLVNGRRFVSSNPSTQFGPAGAGLQVDLSVVPTALIERVESIGIGGAPTYGSDAITGVTNLILRKDFEGVEASMGIGATDKGDNIRFNISSTFGQNFADGRGNFTVTAAHDRSNGVLRMARDFYRDSLAFAPNPNAAVMSALMPGRNPATDGRYLTHIGFNANGTDGVPAEILIRNHRYSGMTWGGLLFPATGGVVKNAAGELRGFGANADQYYHFDTTGNLVSYNPGTAFGTSLVASGGDGLRINETSQITSDLVRSNLYVTGNFEVNDNVSLFAEASFFKAKAREIVDQSIYNAPYFGGLSGPLTFSVNNPFLNAEARNTLTGLGVTQFRLSRASRDLVENNATSDSKIQRYVIGARGYFDIGQRSADWEVSLNHGRADFEYGQNSLVQQNFINAINVTTDANGNIVCDSSVAGTTVDAACVPLNLFGEGQMSDAAKAYVTRHNVSRAENRQTVFNANMTVGLFDLPGGEFKVNGGYEHRREKAAFLPDSFAQQGLGRAVGIPPISGEYHTNEVFLEALAPLFADVPGINRLDLTLKGRHVRNSLAGNFNAFTYGLQYEPIAGVQLRGNKTRSFRAPAIVELFQPVSTAFFSIPEPCATNNISGGSNPSVRQQNCQAFFNALNIDGSTFTANPGTVQGTSGGNPNLKNEVADSWTAGIVWQPSFAPGLTVAADYYSIDLRDVITSLEPRDIAPACFDNPSFNTADVLNANVYCSMISRDLSTGRANGIATQNINGPTLNYRGWTGEVRYLWNLQDHGKLLLGFQGYFPKRLLQQKTPVVSDESVGEFGYAKRQYQWSANWTGQHWSAGLAATYNSATVYDLTHSPIESRDFYVRDSHTTWDANIGYRFSENARVNFSVMNLRNQLGPFPYVTDALGRRYMLSTTFKF